MSEAMNQPSSADTRKLIDSKPFSVNARIAMQLGRESISSSITAVIELVKNAYDADATLVRIRFKGLGTPNAMMVIDDNGCGMTVDELAKLWMVIGTANKAKGRKSKNSRTVTGEKGLGRLGLDRLCEATTVQSIADGAASGVELCVDWRKYERHDARLDEIKHDIYSIPGLRHDPVTGAWSDYPHGMRLILSRLKEDWTETTLAELRAELSLLVSPFAGEQDFQIELDSGCGLKDIDGPLAPPQFLLDSAGWKVTAFISDDGAVSMRMNSQHHNKVYEELPAPWDKRITGFGHVPHCGPLKLEFFFFPRKPTEFGEQTISRSTITTFLDKNQGIRIYRDGFRVKPYGSPNGDGDWLRLAYKRIISPEGVTQDDKPGNWRVGYNQLIGAVFITREKNTELLDQTNREGLVDGKAFAHLRAFTEEVIRFFELSHQDFEMSRTPRRTAREEAGHKATETIKATETALRKLAEIADQLSPSSSQHEDLRVTPSPQAGGQIPPQDFKAIHNTLDEAMRELAQTAKVFRDENERESKEKDTLANLASLGILAAAFGHETLGWASNCAINAGWLERHLPEHFYFADPGIEQKVREKLQDTCVQARRIETFAEFSIGNVKPHKRRKTILCLDEIVATVLKFFDESLRVNRKISVDSSLPNHSCRIAGFPIDWESVLVNLITNAVWAINEKQPDDRRIRVCLEAVGAAFVLTFQDSGIGLVPGSEERIFLPTVSTKRNKATGEMIGTGMGLTITKNFVEQNSGGSIRAIANGELGGACFVITVPAAGNDEQHE